MSTILIFFLPAFPKLVCLWFSNHLIKCYLKNNEKTGDAEHAAYVTDLNIDEIKWSEWEDGPRMWGMRWIVELYLKLKQSFMFHAMAIFYSFLKLLALHSQLSPRRLIVDVEFVKLINNVVILVFSIFHRRVYRVFHCILMIHSNKQRVDQFSPRTYRAVC